VREYFSYEKKRRVDDSGRRWHFVHHDLGADESVPYEEQPWELLFRDDERKEFGRIRFAKRKNSPYRDYETLVRKIMNDPEFRSSLKDVSTKKLWRRSWK
jgi:hypothetical protein